MKVLKLTASLATSCFREALARLDYLGIAARSADASSSVDQYVVMRANLVLGRFDEAAVVASTLGDSPFLRAFAAAQVAGYRRIDVEGARRQLHDLASAVPADDYLTAEYHFV